MEYRKLISFGKNSFVISLPKPWIRQNKLVKGDLIFLEETGNNLILAKKDDEKQNEEKSRIVSVDGKNSLLIEREVNSAYISNCRTIILKGKEISVKVKELQRIIQGLIALEVMEQTTDSIIAKDFLNMDKVSIIELIRKMDVVTRTMLSETSRIFIDDLYENINERDKDVNRLYFLVYRTVIYNLDNPTKAMKNLRINSVELLKLHLVGFYIEGVADEARRTARFARQTNISVAEKKLVQQFFHKIDSYYVETMKSVYNNDISLALKLSEMKITLNNELDQIEKKNALVPHFSNMTNRLRREISYIHNIGRLIYTVQLTI